MTRAHHLLIILLMTLNACQENLPVDPNTLNERERQAVASLAWLHQADAERDVQEALQRQDTRLLALAGRALNLPGVDPARMDGAGERCGRRALPGSTDIVLGETHRRLLQAAAEYAARYNRLMLAHCPDSD
ncbi:MAG: glutamyl-tRNA amidotransferase [Candidatus Thiodiazotropha sp.]